jgi:hypothetical protein
MRSLGGLHGSAPRAWNEMRERGLLGHYGVMCALGIRWVASDSLALDDAELFAPEPGAPGVHRVLHALPRAYGVPRVEAPGNEEAVLAALVANDFRPDLVAYAGDPAAAGSYPGSAALQLEWIEDGDDAIELATTSPAPSFVVVADAWFPGWRAQIDGARAPLYRLDTMLRGVPVPAGAHRLRMTYEPAGRLAAATTSRVAWLLAALSALALAAAALHARRHAGVVGVA